MMNIVVIGLGSMGKRRIRLLKEHSLLQIYGVDSNSERCMDVQKSLDVICFHSLEEALAAHSMVAAFVCTSPLSHAGIIKTCLEHNLHVFTEINLVQNLYDELVQLAATKSKVLFLSSTPLYKKEMQFVTREVQKVNEPINYIYHIGQYLPDWHPWESYNNYFIGDKRTNGCREIMAIELPWMVTCFGPIKNVRVIKSKNTALKIDYNDNYLMLVEHENGNKGTLAIDVVARKAVRHLEVFSEHLFLSWEGTPKTLKQYDISTQIENTIELEEVAEHQEGYASFISENPYRDEINAFLLELTGKTAARWTFEQDKHVLNWIDKIES